MVLIVVITFDGFPLGFDGDETAATLRGGCTARVGGPV
jgi:hypothetical protein